ncbi:putative cystathionine gamma-synthase/beta-lyase [Lasiosphaeria ovina]|uniref:Cystathionine gamma-synthase/beta-lyase n=1 Tax=Lasiosphaeria ovina TaxID=92902 RepID=A0AAE0N517_9PEZI|nr:putative cystathionine gamma-synthase/beta-lyase [Lasiosphaeria ovina]
MLPIDRPERLSLGDSLPPEDPHAVSVCLPKWADSVGWVTKEPRVVDAMKTGYPRFFIPRAVERLAVLIMQCHALNGGATNTNTEDNQFLILPSRRYATLAHRFLFNKHQEGKSDSITTQRVRWNGLDCRAVGDQPCGTEDIFIVSFPKELLLAAKAFWQYTGFGISSRRATFWSECAPILSESHSSTSLQNDAAIARAELQARMAAGHSSEGFQVNPRDVFLYPTGMAAITEAAIAVQSVQNQTPRVVAVFGFLYVDTFKTLSRILGYSTTVYKYHPSEIDRLEAALKNGTLTLSALFTEFPGNPLLQSPCLSSLHALSTQHNFLLIVDDTLSSYPNVNLLPECDLICTSLTKLFSGKSNVMGGSVIVSPTSRYSSRLHTVLTDNHDPATWFPNDVITMERNSRDFPARAHRASSTAEKLVSLLRAHPAVEEIYYPKGSPTEEIYAQHKRPNGGWGHILSIRFKEASKAVVFHDGLDVAKGPSLGTNFTLASPYAVLAHWGEREWAAGYGVVEHLVRISVGLEGEEWVLGRVKRALEEVEAT